MVTTADSKFQASSETRVLATVVVSIVLQRGVMNVMKFDGCYLKFHYIH